MDDTATQPTPPQRGQQPPSGQMQGPVPQNPSSAPLPQEGSWNIGNTQSTPTASIGSTGQTPVSPVSPQPTQPLQPIQPQPFDSTQGQGPLGPIQSQGPVPIQQSVPPIPQEGSQIEDDKLPFSEKKLSLDDLYGTSGSTPNPPSEPSISLPQAPIPPVASVSDDTSTAEEKEDAMPESVVSPQPQQQGDSLSSIPVPEAARPLSQATSAYETDMSGGGFRIPPFVRFLLGGLVVFVILFFAISLISSFFRHSSSKNVTLTYWGLWEDSNVMQGVVSDFERQNPTIHVDYVKQDPKDYTARLLTRIQNGTGPDIFRFHNTWITPLQSVLLPLSSDVISPQQLQNTYYPVVRQDLVKNGAVYGLPLQMDTLSLFVNKDIFTHAGATVPTTWDQFVTVAKALTVKDPAGKIKTSGAAIGTYNNITHAPDIVSLLMLQNGANVNQLQNSSNANDALTFYTSFAKGDNAVWDSTLDNSLLAFERGSVAMYFGYSWDIFAIKAAAPQLSFDVYPVPHLPNRSMTIASYWAEGISNKSSHPKEALLFMKYLAQKDTQTKLYTDEAKERSFGEFYARSDLAESLKNNPAIRPFITQAASAVSSFFIGETQYTDFNGRLNQYLGNAINSVLTDTSVETAMMTLSEGVTQVFSQYAAPTP